MCSVLEALDHDSDHLPIGRVLDLSLRNVVLYTRHSYDQTPTASPTPEVLDINGTILISALLNEVHTLLPK